MAAGARTLLSELNVSASSAQVFRLKWQDSMFELRQVSD